MPRAISPTLAATAVAGGSSGVASYNGRSGAVLPVFGDVNTDLVENASTTLPGQTLTEAIEAAAETARIGVRGGYVDNPASPYTPVWDGKVAPIRITDGRALEIHKPATTPDEPLAGCSLEIRCESTPCQVRAVEAEWDARDGVLSNVVVEPGQTYFFHYYFANGAWTAVGSRVIDDDVVAHLPLKFGAVGPASVRSVVETIDHRVGVLESAGPDIIGVTEFNGETGSVTLVGRDGVIIGEDGAGGFSATLDRSVIGGVRGVSVAGAVSTPALLTATAGPGLALDADAAARGEIRYQLAGGTSQTPVTVPALVHSAVPNVSATGTTPVVVIPSLVLPAFAQVGDTIAVRITGRINFPTSASGSKGIVFSPTIDGQAQTLAGPSVAASSSGRYWILTGHMTRLDGQTLAATWQFRLSNVYGSIEDGGNWASTTVAPAGVYAAATPSVTVADWTAVPFSFAVGWAADAETKALIVETAMVERLGRDFDGGQTNKLLVSAGSLTTDISGTTPTDLLPAVSLLAGILDKPGASVELLFAGAVTSASATPQLALRLKVNGALTTYGTPTAFAPGVVSGQRKLLVRVRLYRVSATEARARIAYVLGAGGSANGSLAANAAIGHDTTALITGLDFSTPITLGVDGAWSVTTGTPHLLASWFHCRRASDALGRAVSTTPVYDVLTPVGSWPVAPGTLGADGDSIVVRGLLSVAYVTSKGTATGTQYPTLQISVAGTAVTLSQAVTAGTRTMDVEVVITRVSATQLRVVSCDNVFSMANTVASPMITFDPATAFTVAVSCRMTNSTPSITPEFFAIAKVADGGETELITSGDGYEFADATGVFAKLGRSSGDTSIGYIALAKKGGGFGYLWVDAGGAVHVAASNNIT